MKSSMIVVCLVLAVAFVVTAGCTQNATPPATPVPTAIPGTKPVAPQTTAPAATTPQVAMGTPGPTQNAPT